jgi:NitT/TauT family transport system substrate-binding protein
MKMQNDMKIRRGHRLVPTGWSSYRLGRLAAIVAVVGLVAAGCGDDDTTSDQTQSEPSGSASGDSGASPGATEGPGTPAPQPLPEQTRVVIESFGPSELTWSTVAVADAMGEFERENLDVELVTGTLPPQAQLNVATGQTQLYVGGLSPGLFNGVQTGTADTRMVADIGDRSPESRDGLYVRNDWLDADGEVDPDQIPGMSFAVGGGETSPLSVFVQQWLTEYGYVLDDVEMPDLGGPDMLLALERGSVDAGWLASPFWQSDTVATCCTQVLGDLPTLGKYIFGTKFLEEEPETAEAIVRALARTNRTYLQGDYHDDPEVMAILSEALGAPAEQIASSDEYVFDPNLGIDLDYVTKAQEIWITGGALEFEGPLHPDRVVDTSVVENALG